MRKELNILLCSALLLTSISTSTVWGAGEDKTFTQGTSTATGEFGNLTVESGAGMTVEDTVTAETLTVKETGTVTGGSSLTTGKLTNSGTITGDRSTLTVTGGGSNSAKGTITQQTFDNQSGSFENNGTITSSVTNSGTISGTGTLNLSGGTNSSGSITQAVVTVTGAYENNAEMTVTTTFTDESSAFSGTGNLTLQGTSTVGESATVTQKDITNSGSLENNGSITANGTFQNTKTVTGTGTLNVNGGSNSGTITQKTFGNQSKSTFTNSGTITAAVTNSGTITGEGTINISGGTNNADSSITQAAVNITGDYENKGTITATKTFTNDGHSVTNTGGTIEISEGASGTNSGTITNGTLSVGEKGTFTNGITSSGEAAESASVSVDKLTTAQGANYTNKSGNTTKTETLENNGKINNEGAFDIGSTLTNNGEFFNSGAGATLTAKTVTNGSSEKTDTVFGAINGATLNLESIKNYGEVTVRDGSSLTLSNQTDALEGNVTVYGLGEDNKGNTLDIGEANITGAFTVGDGENNTILDFVNGNVTGLEGADANVNIAKGGKVLLGQSGKSSITLNSGDNWSGDIEVKGENGSLTLDNFSVTTGSRSTLEGGNSPYYAQEGGLLELKNGSVFVHGDASKITGGNINIDGASTYQSAMNGFTAADVNVAGTLGAMNGGRETYTFDNLIIGSGDDSDANLTLDLYARCSQEGRHGSDIFNGNVKLADGLTSGTLNITDWGLGGDLFGWDAPLDPRVELGKVFTGEMAEGVDVQITDKEVFTPIGYYKLNTSNGINNLRLELTRFNPQVYRGQVATLAQWQNQLLIDDMLFNHSMLLPSFKENDYDNPYGLNANKYAAESPLFAPYQYSRKEGGLWYKMYGNFEHLQMSQHLNVGNNSYGALIGADFGLKELRNGWKFMPTAYIGYTGAHQYFAKAGNYQNGGQLGFLGTWYKDNFIAGALVYGGIYENWMDVYGRTDKAFNYFAGAATKLAYNWRFHRDWVLQPNILAAYNYFGQQNWHSDFGQMGMMAGMLNGVNVAPGLNLIWEKETFSIYLTLQYMYNINGSIGGVAGHTYLPRLHMEHGYIQYGIGFTKRITERLSGYFQAVLRNAGRTGGGFQLGLTFLLGK